MNGSLALAGQDLVNLFCCKRQDGCDGPDEGLQDRIHGCLSGPPCQGVGGLDVHRVLDDVEVDRGEIDRAEIEQPVVNRVELVLLVRLMAALDGLGGARQDPAIDVAHLGIRHRLRSRIEVAQVRQQEARGVPDLPIALGDPRHDLLADRHVVAVVHHGNPQAEDVGAVLFDDVLRRDDVADRLRHLAALLVHDEAAGDDPLERRAVLDPAADEERRLEPAAMLVVALEVNGGRPGQLRPRLEHRDVGAAGVEPDVEDVQLLPEAPPAARATLSRAEKIGRWMFVPCISPFTGEELPHPGEELRRGDDSVALLAVEDRDRNAPKALPGDAPVGSVGHHAGHPFFTPRGKPLHFPDLLERAAAQTLLVHADEPLLGGPEDDRVLAAPAVRVGVGDGLLGQQSTALAQKIDDGRIGLEDMHPFPRRSLDGELAAMIDRREDLEAILATHLEVVGAVTGRCVHEAGAGLDRHMLAEDEDSLARIEGMTVSQVLEHGALEDLPDRIVVPAELTRGSRDQFACQDVVLAVVLDDGVIEIRSDCDGQVGRKRPGRGRPDHGIERLLDRKAQTLDGIVGQTEADVHRRRGMVLVFDLSLGQRRLTVSAPVHRLETLVDHPGLKEASERVGDGRLILEGHRQIRMVPVAEDGQPLEVVALDVDVFRGELPACAAEVGRRHLLLFRAQLLVHCVLDGEAMAVPARHIRRVVSEHRARLDDDVLENLVQGVTDVDPAVRIRRTVMKDELRFALGLLANEAVQSHLFPLRETLRLVLQQVGLHGEGGLRKVQRFLVVAFPGRLGH